MRWIHGMYLLRANTPQPPFFFLSFFFSFQTKKKKQQKPSEFTFPFNSTRPLRLRRALLRHADRWRLPRSRSHQWREPAGQRRAITALWLSMWFPPINLGEMAPIEIPLRLPSRQTLSSLAASVVSKGAPLMRQSDVGRQTRRLGWIVAPPGRPIGGGGENVDDAD